MRDTTSMEVRHRLTPGEEGDKLVKTRAATRTALPCYDKNAKSSPTLLEAWQARAQREDNRVNGPQETNERSVLTPVNPCHKEDRT